MEVENGNRAVTTSVASAFAKSCLKDRISNLFNNETLSDVNFLVGSERVNIPAHKCILIVGSPVFDAMFTGPLQESERTVELPDVEAEAFLSLLKYLYTDELSFPTENALSVLYAAKKYGVQVLENHCGSLLSSALTPENAFLLLGQARLFDEAQLAKSCLDCIDLRTKSAINSDEFLEVDLGTLSAVIERDTLFISEVDLFHAVLRWSASECARRQVEVTPKNQRKILGPALNLIRFPIMTANEFAENVASLGLLSDAELVKLFLYFNLSSANQQHQQALAFSDRLRRGTLRTQLAAYRFQNVASGWTYGGRTEKIHFTADRRIYVLGFGLFGGLNYGDEYTVDIEISMGFTKTKTSLGQRSDTFKSDGSNSTFKILFKEPIEILPDVVYIASAHLQGPSSYRGVHGKPKVQVKCSDNTTVNISFFNCSGYNNGTSPESGQIPEIIFLCNLF